MGIFSVKQKKLEEIIKRLEVNKSNNYKDAAQKNFLELKECFFGLKKAERLKSRQESYYASIIENYEADLAGYTHKDQTPYWK